MARRIRFCRPPGRKVDVFISVMPPVNVPSPQRTVSPLKWAFRGVLWLLFLLWSLLVLAWLALHWAILPHIQQWRPQIEARASEALGATVNIGHIEVRSSGWVPALELRDVVLRDAQGRPALSLPRVATALSPRSLLALEPRLEQLLIEGAHLEVRRDADGRVFVAGLDLSGPGGENTDAADWLVRQHEIVIRGGSLRWTDERREAEPLQLDNVQLVLRNGLRRHDLRLDATPPPEWGERFTLRARFTHGLLARAGDWQRWSGAVHAELPRADLSELRRYVALPFELSQGIGALRAWVDVLEGQAQGGTADIALRSVALRLAPNVAPLALEMLEGRVVGQRTADGLTIALHDFGFLSGDGTRWPAGDLNLSLRQRAGEPSTGGQFSAQRLDLHALAQVAASLPLGDAVRRLVAEVKPQGELNELAARWTGPLDAPTHYQINGALSGLFLASRASSQPHTVGRPGLRNASVQLTANQAGGSAMLGLVDGAIELPGVFEEPLLPLDRLSAQLLWKIDAGRLS
ncbi:MAG: AsmA family protein, partial [Rhizobacter sp.]|nr:AsmA family protein [Rhizobacter sp.]